jgi:hypothetical protein
VTTWYGARAEESAMSRFLRPALVLLTLLACAVIPSVAGAETAPAYVYGDLTLFDAPLKSSAKVVAMVGTTACGTGDVKSGTYSVVVKSKCGPPNAPVQFKLVFSAAKGNTAEDAYWASTNALPFPGMGDQRKYDLAFPTLTGQPVTPAEGCVELVSTFANKTPVTTISARLHDQAASSVWKWDAKKGDWQGYIPGDAEEPLLATLKDVNRGESFVACYDPANPPLMLTQPTAP